MISSYQVQVFERTFNDKGNIVGQTLNETLSGVVNAESPEIAQFIAQLRACDGVNTDDATAVATAFRKYLVTVKQISPLG